MPGVWPYRAAAPSRRRFDRRPAVLLAVGKRIARLSPLAGSRAHLFGKLDSWGWPIWLVGDAQGLTGVGVLVENQFARSPGVVAS